MNPDLGQHLWETGLADKKVILVGADFQTIAESPKKTRDVSFFITLGEERYCGTLNTRQQIRTILRLTAAGSSLMVEGRLAKGTGGGQGGESYRLIVGILKSLPVVAP
jgi:hypothetical protein